MINGKVGIIGASGMTGSELRKLYYRMNNPYIFDFNPSDSLVEKIDITNIEDLRSKLRNFGVGDWIINAAADNDVDGAEDPSKRENNWKVNVQGPKNLAQLSNEQGMRLIHFGSAYEFDGKGGDYTPYEPTNPLSVYGTHKLEGGRAILNSHNILIRTDLIYGENGPKNFVDAIIRNASVKDSIDVVNDQIGCPTYSADLARVTQDILEHEGGKSKWAAIYHAVGPGKCTREEFARGIILAAGLKCKVNGVSTAEWNAKYRKGLLTAERPYDVSLDTEGINGFKAGIHHWQSNVRRYLSKKKSLKV